MQDLIMMLDNLPANKPLYKDTGLWQIRTDDMEEVIFQQECNESFYHFIKRAFEVDNDFMGCFGIALAVDINTLNK